MTGERYIELLRRGLLEIRFLSNGRQEGDVLPRINELANILHNVPSGVTNPASFDEVLLTVDLHAYERKYGPFGVGLSDALSIFRELDQVELNVAKQSGATFVIIPEVYSEDELLTAYQSQMRTMHGKNWDALDEVLVDCDNYKSDVVYIVHHYPPRLPSRETAIYARILLGAIEDHNVGPRNGRVLPQRKIEFHVTFLAEGDDKREQLWGLLSDQA